MITPNPVWNLAVLEAPTADPFDLKRSKLIKLMSSRNLRTRPYHLHTRADPFLLVRGDYLYVFYEVQCTRMKGHIEACRTTDLTTFEPLGVVLREPHHLSYPMVFEDSGDVYIVPESSEAGEVALYRFDDFPKPPTRVRRLLGGAPYADTTVARIDDRWWLFTYLPSGLHLFSAASLDDEFKPHPKNPICTDPQFARCGGPIIFNSGSMYRMAQDTRVYGSNLSAMEIVLINPNDYEERIHREDLFDRSHAWQGTGGHHFSLVSFKGHEIIAVDGQQDDFTINRLLGLLFRVFER